MIAVIIFISFLIASITIVISSIGITKKNKNAQTEQPNLEEVLSKKLDDMTIDELKFKAEREFGKNFNAHLPKEYRLVDEVPKIEDREKGVKYVRGNEEFKDNIERYDLVRFISGERYTVTDIPVKIITKDELVNNEQREVLREIVEDEHPNLSEEEKNIKTNKMISDEIDKRDLNKSAA